jgi:acetyl esterase/lipase
MTTGTRAKLDLRVRVMMWIAARLGQTFRPEFSVERMRRVYFDTNRRLGSHDRGAVDTRDVSIPADDGATFGARLYRPHAAGSAVLPLLVYFHGGGWVIGDVAGYDHLARFIALEGGIAVLSVDYRLGPEHRFPRAHEDAFAALGWAQRSATELGVDPSKIAVGGDSAGGNLSAALSAFAADRGLARPVYQLLIYPGLDGTARFPSRRQYDGNLPLTPAAIGWFLDHYLRSPADAASPYMVPLDAPFPERLPPTYVLAAQFDPLVDEGYAYAERLRAAGVPVVYDLRATLPHAFVNMIGAVPEARRAVRKAVAHAAAALNA